LVQCEYAWAQTLAFPGALGFGQFSHANQCEDISSWHIFIDRQQQHGHHHQYCDIDSYFSRPAKLWGGHPDEQRNPALIQRNGEQELSAVGGHEPDGNPRDGCLDLAGLGNIWGQHGHEADDKLSTAVPYADIAIEGGHGNA
jgi:hypothetical protein